MQKPWRYRFYRQNITQTEPSCGRQFQRRRHRQDDLSAVHLRLYGGDGADRVRRRFVSFHSAAFADHAVACLPYLSCPSLTGIPPPKWLAGRRVWIVGNLREWIAKNVERSEAEAKEFARKIRVFND